MISPCTNAATQQICDVINEASKAYLGVIPDDCWHEPYMSLNELQAERPPGYRSSGTQHMVNCSELWVHKMFTA